MDALTDEPPKIGASLDPIRAAISLVADGVARRVTINLPSAEAVMSFTLPSQTRNTL